jgi:hypothetical protein
MVNEEKREEQINIIYGVQVNIEDFNISEQLYSNIITLSSVALRDYIYNLHILGAVEISFYIHEEDFYMVVRSDIGPFCIRLRACKNTQQNAKQTIQNIENLKIIEVKNDNVTADAETRI